MSDDEKNMDLSSNQSPQSKPARRQSWEYLTADYLNDLPRQLDELKTMLKQKDFAAIKKHAHRIKGTSATYRLDDISKSATQLQHIADTQKPKAVSAVIDELARLVQLQAGRLNSLTLSSADESERLTDD
ncbi:MAG: Hpt domain-containing protein [Planctomycetota bacterium]|jgi:HPt (histidine-containing phosphotransfer) domain-containing protein